jgi:hypothetical protein
MTALSSKNITHYITKWFRILKSWLHKIFKTLKLLLLPEEQVEKSLLLLILKNLQRSKKSQIFTDSHQDFSAQPAYFRSKLLLRIQKGPT